MFNVVKSRKFDDWLRQLKDQRALARIQVRIDRLAGGNPGDARPVGGGVSELRIDYGPGYRVYFLQDGRRQIILLLCGGAKSSQQEDITRAKQMATDWRRNDRHT